MSKEISTIKGATYVVTPTVDGTVSTPSGTVIATFAVGTQTSFVATGKLVIVSDEQAAVDIYFNPAAPSVQGSGRMLTHLKDASLHLSAEERSFLERLLEESSVVDLPVPDGALPHADIRSHFALNAQQGESSAPSRVYVSRVPWARWDEDAAQWVNNACEVDEAVFGVSRKLLDNEGLVHECSTDTVEGQDDYIGSHWPFYCARGNYMTDEHGVKHVTAIEGQVVRGATFDPSKPVCAFGPAFWFFCVTEHSKDEESGTWRTHDGTQGGVPLFQLWGISARPWNELDAQRRAKLTALGVSEADFHLWPEATQWDSTNATPAARPYWCHSAYFGGAELQENGSYIPVSKPNLPILNYMSYAKLNGYYGNRAGCGGSACVNGFGMLFDIVKNATKNSQAIHAGNVRNYPGAVRAAHSTAAPGYVFPISTCAHFTVGCTVYLGQVNANISGISHMRSSTLQIGRIASIETRELELADGSTASSLCLVFDPATVEPFVVRSGSDDAAAIAATKALTDEGIPAACFATQGFSLTGETDTVIGRHDGSRTSNTDEKHAYRVQLTEYMSGTWIVAADTVAIKGTGEIAVVVDGEASVPSATQYVILQAGYGVERMMEGSLQAFLDGGYIPIGIAPAEAEGYILNCRLSVTGVAYPVANGGTGSSSSTGHADYYNCGAEFAGFIMSGPLYQNVNCGSAALYVRNAPQTAHFHIGGRD